ncbi:MAG: hypothetical protein JO279_15045 [Verrucomicrobia bacterium]|nr:hypothetical protein [Verrucomicrobiota bacterium]
MPLIFQVDDKGRVRPKIQCDSCGGVVENYADGVALVDTKELKPGEVTQPIFHCVHCEEKEKGKAPRQSMPIDHFMLYVLNNIQLTPNALQEARQSLRSLSGP